MTTTIDIKIGSVVYIGSSRVKHVVLEKVNEFQLRITNKRDYDNGDIYGGWLVDINSVTI